MFGLCEVSRKGNISEGKILVDFEAVSATQKIRK